MSKRESASLFIGSLSTIVFVQNGEPFARSRGQRYRYLSLAPCQGSERIGSNLDIACLPACADSRALFGSLFRQEYQSPRTSRYFRGAVQRRQSSRKVSPFRIGNLDIFRLEKLVQFAQVVATTLYSSFYPFQGLYIYV